MSKRSSILLAAAFVTSLALVGCGGESTTTAVDTVAPAAVLDLQGDVVTTGGLSVELVWSASSEPDVAAYRVYRAQNGGAAALVGVETVPAFVDGTVAWGAVYTYEVTAVDASQNESPRVAAVVVTPSADAAGGSRQHVGD
jgi:fibronectin type 3 domain-containing protein